LRRQSSRDDRPNAASGARLLSNRLPGCRCHESCSCRPWQAGAAPPRRGATSFFLRFMGELSFDHIAIECAFFVEQGRGAGAEAVRAVVATGACIVAHDPQGLVNRVVGHRRIIVMGEQVAAAASVAFRIFVSLSSSMGGLPHNRGGQPVYPALPVYPQCTRRCRTPSDGGEPYRASILPDFATVFANRRTGAEEKERGRKGQWCPGAGCINRWISIT
jgi:hypothetical protein